MYLTSMVHRDRLFELATRWFGDEVAPSDGRFLTQVFIYESLISGPTGRRFLADILGAVHGSSFELRRINLKDDLREAILTGCLAPTQRMEGLFHQYLELPEEFFPRTPVDMVLATSGDGILQGLMRLKRVRRVAEKASRRVADRLAGTIRRHARMLAQARADAAGIALDELLSSPEVMNEDFRTAERIVSQAFRDQAIGFAPSDMRIDDILGFKFIGSHAELERIEQVIASHPAATIAEREEHRGAYNDINLLVDLALPPPDRIVSRMQARDWSFAAERGLSPGELARRFPEYVMTGARDLRAEVILTTYDELVESEFGRAIHEERIFDQRLHAPYAGRIANNAAYVIEYLLMLAISPTIDVEELPVKMWGRYLPDTFSRAVWQLFGIGSSSTLYDPFLMEVGDRSLAADGMD